MQSSEFPAFKALIVDLGVAYNVPVNDDRVRVMWEALRLQSFKAVEQLATVHRATNKKFPTPAELSVQKYDRPIQEDKGPTLQEQLCNHVVRHYEMTPRQRAGTWTWLVQWFDDLDKNGKAHKGANLMGVEIPADGDEPGFRVMLSDMHAMAA